MQTFALRTFSSFSPGILNKTILSTGSSVSWFSMRTSPSAALSRFFYLCLSFPSPSSSPFNPPLPLALSRPLILSACIAFSCLLFLFATFPSSSFVSLPFFPYCRYSTSLSLSPTFSAPDPCHENLRIEYIYALLTILFDVSASHGYLLLCAKILNM